MTDYNEAIQQAVEAMRTSYHDTVEHGCELMLTTPGDYGLMVTETWENYSYTVVCELTHEVPAMTIAYQRKETL